MIVTPGKRVHGFDQAVDLVLDCVQTTTKTSINHTTVILSRGIGELIEVWKKQRALPPRRL